MFEKRPLSAILALTLLFAGSGSAWGCEETGMQNCSMSECPMTIQRDAGGCHEAEGSKDRGSTDCGSAPESWLACCGAPAEPGPAKIDSSASWDDSMTPLNLLAEEVAPQPPPRPPDPLSQAVASRQYELGRFTLLSAFLL